MRVVKRQPCFSSDIERTKGSPIFKSSTEEWDCSYSNSYNLHLFTDICTYILFIYPDTYIPYFSVVLFTTTDRYSNSTKYFYSNISKSSRASFQLKCVTFKHLIVTYSAHFLQNCLEVNASKALKNDSSSLWLRVGAGQVSQSTQITLNTAMCYPSWCHDVGKPYVTCSYGMFLCKSDERIICSLWYM